MSYSRFALMLGLVFILLGMAEFVHPFGPPMLRSNPVLVVIVGALLAARHLAREAARKRQQMLDEVPKHPLGLDDEGGPAPGPTSR